MNTHKQHTHNQGQTLVEFALLVPILLTIMFAIVDLGRAVYFYSAIQNSAREGARYGIINPFQTSEIENRVRSSAVGLDQSTLQVYPTVPDPGDAVRVHVQYTFRALTPVLPSLMGINQLQLNTYATMNIEK